MWLLELVRVLYLTLGVAFFVCDDSVNYGYLSIHLSSVDVS